MRRRKRQSAASLWLWWILSTFIPSWISKSSDSEWRHIFSQKYPISMSSCLFWRAMSHKTECGQVTLWWPWKQSWISKPKQQMNRNIFTKKSNYQYGQVTLPEGRGGPVATLRHHYRGRKSSVGIFLHAGLFASIVCRKGNANTITQTKKHPQLFSWGRGLRWALSWYPC